METDPHRWIAALRRSQDRLASLVQPLTPEQLRVPSYHDWTIAKVLGRLGSQTENYIGWLTVIFRRERVVTMGNDAFLDSLVAAT
jgi:hypothetical protein